MSHYEHPLGRRRLLGHAAAPDLTAARLPAPLSAPTVTPLSLPIAGKSSPRTWWIDQWYGNTTFAYRARHNFYASGQGLHFGVDFGMSCSTKIISAGQGVVREIGGVSRAWPLHVAIDHHDLGVTTLYGHLSRSVVTHIGQEVHRGEVIGESGDSITFACCGSPHLHFELRYNHMSAAANPIPWIEADWPALYSPAGDPPFEIDLENPMRWQSIYEQPDVRFGGPFMNNYKHPWPPA